MARQAFRLAMKTPLHVGERGVGLEATMAYIPSDTLFGALVVTWQEMAMHQRVVPNIRKEFQGAPPLLLTSTFPYAGEILFLPKPLLPLRPQGTGDESPKKFKKVQWISTAVCMQLLQGITQEALNTLWQESELLQEGSIWVTAPEAKQIRSIVEPDEEDEVHLWSPQRVPKVTVDRIRNAGTLFHVGRLHFAEGCGLWCMAEGEEVWLTRMADALSLLAESGIGGQRSRGNGQFALELFAAPPLGDPAAQTAYSLLLSRFAPTVEEMTLLKAEQASYQLITVGGFTGTPNDPPLVRRQLRLLKEGSIIGRKGDGSVPGKLVNVNPYWDDEKEQLVPLQGDAATNPNVPLIRHAIHRYGFGFTLPVQMPAGEETDEA